MNIDTDTLKITFGVFIMLLVGIYATYIYMTYLYQPMSVEELLNVEKEKMEYPDCGNKTLSDTANCLGEYVNDNFYYKVTPDNKIRTIQQMKEEGGDCNDYTNFYQRYLNYYGFTDNKRVMIDAYEKDGFQIAHVFLIAYDEKGYCHLDINVVRCFRYGDRD